MEPERSTLEFGQKVALERPKTVGQIVSASEGTKGKKSVISVQVVEEAKCGQEELLERFAREHCFAEDG